MQCQRGTDVWETSHQSSRWLQWWDVTLTPSASEFEARLPADPKESCHSASLGNWLATQSTHEDKGRLGTLFISPKEMCDHHRSSDSQKQGSRFAPHCLVPWPSIPPLSQSCVLAQKLGWAQQSKHLIPRKPTHTHTHAHKCAHIWGITLHEKNSYKGR